MPIHRALVLSVVLAASIAGFAPCATNDPPSPLGFPAQIVITVQSKRAGTAPRTLRPKDITVEEDGKPTQVIGLDRLRGRLAGIQLFVLLDFTGDNAIGPAQLSNLESFFGGLPETTELGVGYLQESGISLTQPFTVGHLSAVQALGIPGGPQGASGGLYAGLSSLMNHWPTQHQIARKAVLILTDGADRYQGAPDAAIQDALRTGVQVYSIALRDAGPVSQRPGANSGATDPLADVCRQTGGEAYAPDSPNPSAIGPYLDDLTERLDSQYRVTFTGEAGRGTLPVKLRTDLTDIKVAAPSSVYVR